MPFIDLAAQQKRIRPQLDKAIMRVLDHGKYSLGPECFEFEAQLSAYTGAPHVLGCSNGTDALTMLLIALDVQPGEAVFVPSFTFVATAEVVALRGAVPVFVDVDPVTFNMSPSSLEEAIQAAKEKGMPVKGIISVDLFGHPAPHDEIENVAKRHDLWVIVDGAQSLGATYKGRHTVTYGTAATTSFFPAKPLGGYGDGGAIFTDSAELAEKLKEIRVHGQVDISREGQYLGLTGRLDTLQAAILIEKLKIFPEEVANRNKAAERYSARLKDVCQVPAVQDGCTSVWAQYTVQVDKREALLDFLKEREVPVAVYYKKPIHMHSLYQKGLLGRHLIETDTLSKNVLSLPMHGYLDQETQEYIIDSFLSFFRK
ncbi:DegT/DnrJ/EryC1/StrS family aminotransferase [Alphaproteobacteria bacterium]|nr:DegT/DnrJ/EryC1/StrS family aminotransferase [Alphaproteobacteria bacterium]